MTNNRKYFGTDGIRGRVGKSLVNPEFVLKLGWAIGKVFADKPGRNRVLVGKDTRISGYMLESALEAGLSAAGISCRLLGPMPTPAVAYLTRTFRAKAGVMISASHNMYYDNGLKFFDVNGQKLPDEVELEIEHYLDQDIETVESEQLGGAKRYVDAPGRYIEFCKSTIPSRTTLNGLTIVVDCANGATYHVAPRVLRELGAEVITVAVEPDGFNINDKCGTTDPTLLQAAVLKHKADVGIAFDGDGDRVMMVDHKGEVVDGDELLYIIAKDFKQNKILHGGVVGTTMTNLGLEKALAGLEIEFIRSQVGDRYVLAEMLKKNWHLGGESSGHIVCLNSTTTGDGIISAFQVLSAMFCSEKSLYELKKGMIKFPQSLINVKSDKSLEVVNHVDVQSAVREVQTKLNSSGRVLLRPSGTEPLVRVMVEGEDAAEVLSYAEHIANVVKSIN